MMRELLGFSLRQDDSHEYLYRNIIQTLSVFIVYNGDLACNEQRNGVSC